MTNHKEHKGLTYIDMALLEYLKNEEIFESEREGAGKLKILAGYSKDAKNVPSDAYITAGKKIAHATGKDKRNLVGTLNFLGSSAKIYNNVMKGYLEEMPRQIAKKQEAEEMPTAETAQEEYARYKARKAERLAKLEAQEGDVEAQAQPAPAMPTPKVKKEKINKPLDADKFPEQIVPEREKPENKPAIDAINKQSEINRKLQLIDYDQKQMEDKEKRRKENTVIAKKKAEYEKEELKSAAERERPAAVKDKKPKNTAPEPIPTSVAKTEPEKRYVMEFPKNISKQTKSWAERAAASGHKVTITPPKAKKR